MRWIILVRHVESYKNLNDSFATPGGMELLTEAGRASLPSLARSIEGLIANMVGAPTQRIDVLSGTSVRTRETAEAVAKQVAATHIESTILDSFDSPVTRGRSMAALIDEDPNLARAILTYRAGLRNSYSVHPSFARELRDFEGRLSRLMDQILANDETDIAVIVSSRSPITAALIHFARTSGIYPSDFFGYVALPDSSVSVVAVGAADRKPSVRVVGASPKELTGLSTWILG